jgi:soluble lytic murein transglycosylase-like protein
LKFSLKEETAARLCIDDPFDATANVRGSAAYLSWLLQEFSGDPVLALAGYNAGENAVKTAGGVPNYAETRGYVPKVLAAYSVARGLCKTPPVLVTDGCIFQLPDGN